MKNDTFFKCCIDLKWVLSFKACRKNGRIITRKNNENVVVISLVDYNSLMETDYLLSSEKNAKRLLSSLEEARSGKGFEKELIEE